MSAKQKPARQVPEDTLFFSTQYTAEKAERYYRKHRESLGRRISDWREKQMARRALMLAGNPKSVLDMPCGAGRFWTLLAEDSDRELLAADYSGGMLRAALKFQPQELSSRFRLVQTSAFAMSLGDEAVENIFCMRLFHHIEKAGDRARILREFHRVTRDTVCLSLWVDGNYQARRRKRLERLRASGKRPSRHRKWFRNRFVQPASSLEQEFRDSGFEVIGEADFLPGYSMWRTYILGKRH